MPAAELHGCRKAKEEWCTEITEMPSRHTGTVMSQVAKFWSARCILLLTIYEQDARSKKAHPTDSNAYQVKDTSIVGDDGTLQHANLSVCRTQHSIVPGTYQIG